MSGVRPIADPEIVGPEDVNPGEYGIYDKDERVKEFLGHCAGWKLGLEFYNDDGEMKKLIAPWMKTDGYDDVLDYERINAEIQLVFVELADGRWRNRIELADVITGMDSGLSACIRYFRTEPIGSYPVQKRRDPTTHEKSGIWQYRVGTQGTWMGREKPPVRIADEECNCDDIQQGWEHWIATATVEQFLKAQQRVSAT